MNYFKVLYDYEHDTNAGYIRLNESSLSFSRYDVNESQPLKVNKIFCEVEHENIENYDYIANNLAWLIVSEKVKRILSSFNLGEHEFIQIVESKNNEIVGYLVHSMNLLDAFDERKAVFTKSKFTINGNDLEHLIVIKYAIRAEKVGNFDVYKLKVNNIPYFVSEVVKNKLSENNINGFNFLPIITT